MRILARNSKLRFGTKATWYNAELHKPNFGEVQKVTLIPGIGIGPEITSNGKNIKNAFWKFLKLPMFLSNSKPSKTSHSKISTSVNS